MTGLGWQDVAVAAIAVAAVAFLIWRRRLKKKPKPQLVGLGRAPKRAAGPPGTNG